MTSPLRRTARTLTSAIVAVALAGVSLATASAEAGSETVDGHVVDVIVDTPGEPTEERVFVDADGGVAEVELPEGLEDVASGTEVTATVDGGTAEVLSTRALRTTAPAAPIVKHRAYVVAVNDSTTTTDVPLATATSATQSALAYWLREARGAISTFDVASSATLTLGNSCSYGVEDLWDRAAALFPGVNFMSSPNHLVLYSPTGCSLGYTGVATVGEFTGGGYVQIVEPLQSTIVHELGHNFGLAHANVLMVLGDGDSAWWEYYGAFGPQSASIESYPPGVLDAGFRHFLDLPDLDAQTTVLDVDVPATETVTLAPTGATTGDTSFTIRDDAAGETYFVEFRDGAGDDAAAFYASVSPYLAPAGNLVNYSPGVVISVMDDRFPGDLDVLAEYDATDEEWDAAGGAGDTFVDPWGRFQVDVLSVSTGAATVTVTTDGVVAPPMRAESTTTVSAPAAAYGTPATVTVTVGADVDATGTVDLYRGMSKVATLSLEDGAATHDLSATLAVGTYRLTAVYSGSDTVKPSQGEATLRVNKQASTVLATSTSAPYGSAAKVAVTAAAPAGPTGAVTLTYGTRTWTTSLNDAGKATFWMPKRWKPATRTLDVRYAGSSTVKASTTTVRTTVTKAKPKISSSPTTAIRRDQRATFVVTVAGPAAAPESGWVRLFVGSTAVSSKATLMKSGSVYKATVTTWKLPQGDLRVKYSGNAYLKMRAITSRYSVG